MEDPALMHLHGSRKVFSCSEYVLTEELDLGKSRVSMVRVYPSQPVTIGQKMFTISLFLRKACNLIIHHHWDIPIYLIFPKLSLQSSSINSPVKLPPPQKHPRSSYCVQKNVVFEWHRSKPLVWVYPIASNSG